MRAKGMRALEALAELPSLGKTSAQMLFEADVADVATLHRLGPIECYRRLRFRHGKRVSVNFAYALECAILGIDWRQLGADRKAQLKAEALAVNAQLMTANVKCDRPPVEPTVARNVRSSRTLQRKGG